MDFGRDIDHVLNFHGNSEIPPEPLRIRNFPIVDGLIREASEAINPVDSSLCKQKPSGREYRPCVDVTAEYIKTHV